MKRDLPFAERPAGQSVAAESALAQAHEACRQGNLAIALHHALAAQAQAPAAGLQAAAGLLACFCHFRMGQHRALLALGEPLLWQVSTIEQRLELLRWLTVAAAECGKAAAAQRHGADGLALAEQAGDAAAQTSARQAAALAWLRAGDPWQAERLLLDGLPQAESLPVLRPLLHSLQLLAEAALDQNARAGHAPDADSLADAGSGNKDDDRDGASATRSPSALARAEAYARRGHAAAQHIGERHYGGQFDGLLGEVLLRQGHAHDAATRLAAALAHARSHRQRPLTIRLACAVAECQQACGEPPLPPPTLAAWLADTDADTRLPPSLRPRAHRILARLFHAQGHPADAAAHAAEAERWQRLLADGQREGEGVCGAQRAG